jgi:hypothetical protein
MLLLLKPTGLVNPHAHNTATYNIQSITLSASDNNDSPLRVSSRNVTEGESLLFCSTTFSLSLSLFFVSAFLKITTLLEN